MEEWPSRGAEYVLRINYILVIATESRLSQEGPGVQPTLLLSLTA